MFNRGFAKPLLTAGTTQNIMWTKTVQTKFKSSPIQVLLWFSDTDENGNEVVSIQSMMNEYFLIEKVKFESRDAAYDFIKDYTVSMATSFLNRTAYEAGAVN